MPVVLVVDDTESAREVLAKLLRQAGYQTRTAASAAEALGVLAEARPDLVLLDVTMPDMDGLSLLELLHGQAEWASLPVVMFSAVDARAVVERAEQLGAKAFCVKGRDSFADVLAHVRQHVGA